MKWRSEDKYFLDTILIKKFSKTARNNYPCDDSDRANRAFAPQGKVYDRLSKCDSACHIHLSE